MLYSFQPHFSGNIQDNGKVRNDIANGKGIDLGYGIIRYLTSDALIDRGGIQETVAQNDLTL